MLMSLRLIFGGVNHDLAGIPVHGVESDASTSEGEVVPYAQRQLQRRHLEAQRVDIRAGDRAQSTAVAGHRAHRQRRSLHLSAHTGAVGHHCHVTDHLYALGWDEPSAAQSRADPQAVQTAQIARQLRPQHAPAAPPVAHQRHADHPAYTAHIASPPLRREPALVVSTGRGARTRGKICRIALFAAVWYNRNAARRADSTA